VTAALDGGGSDVPAVPSATLIVIRDAEPGLETLLMRRHALAGFVAGAHVFPGGVVDPGDHDPALVELADGLDDVGASQQLGLESGGLSYWVAAVRECLEEAGLLYVRPVDRAANGPHHPAERDLARLRLSIEHGDIGLADWCRRNGLVLTLRDLAYVAHWITPAGLPRRYDTRFFVAVAPEGQVASHDDRELVSCEWLRPRDAVAADDAGEIELILPTRRLIEFLDRFATTAEVMRFARVHAAASAPGPVAMHRSSPYGLLLPLPGESADA